MDKAKFFATLRQRDVASFGTALSKRQVEGVEAVFGAGMHLPLPHLAHVLAEVHHETGGGMYPIKETVFSSHRNQNPSDEDVIRRLDAAWAKGQLPWVSTPYWRGGFFGRGQIQITHEDNYRKLGAALGVNLAGNPSLALDPKISARIAVVGCEDGLFTDKKLKDYDLPGGGFDHRNARRIVNGYVSKQAMNVASRGRDFETALREAGYEPRRTVIPNPAPIAATLDHPAPRSFWVDLVKAVLAIFRKRN